MSELAEKILLTLLAGIAFGCSVTSGQKRKVYRAIGEIWNDSEKKNFSKEIKNLEKSELVKSITKKEDGNYSIELTERGRLRATEYYFLRNLKIRKPAWDKKWRILIFDIPENFRKGRDALRWKIKKLGFRELQKSVFVIPYECKKEISFVVNYFGLKKYVHYGILESIEADLNESLKKHFEL